MKRVLAAGGVVINQSNELLMIFRRIIWDLPKGHLEKKETMEQCALREVREETGLQSLELIRFLDISEHLYFDHRLGEEAIKETHWYEMKGDKNEPLAPQYAESIERVVWVGAEAVMRYLQYSFDNLQPIVAKSSLFSSG
ncbi:MULTISPECIES: NUDIX hydrolase [Chitinophagaceae]